jgi:predicted short-subunit dehydrogenase-like oxidoreductase (DUF2520 family)
MLSRGMKRTVAIVGAGRVGRTLGKCLHERGWRVGAIVARSAAKSRAAVRAIGAGTAYQGLTREVFAAPIVLLTVPDDAIASVAGELARFGRQACRGRTILHMSGALDASVLKPLARLGASTGSLHPMQTFTGRSAPNLKGILFAVEGSPAARRAARAIARSLGGIPVVVATASKPAYHAAGALAAGHALALLEAATRILVQLGFPRRRAVKSLLPLMRQVLDNFERLGPGAAWTGPVARGDYAVVARHMKALRKYPPEFRQAYAALARLGARVLSANPKERLGALKNLLGGTN